MSDKGRSDTKEAAPGGAASRLRRRLLPYGLLAPGAIWLIVFFVVPMYFMAEMSLRSGVPNTPQGFTFSWDFSNYSQALDGRGEQIVRTFEYAGAATIIGLLIAYPLAYAIALKVPHRWRLPLLFAVMAPFFTTYLIRTVAWETILADDSPIVDLLKTLHIVPEDGRVLATSGAVIAGLTYNFLPFMVLPIYASLERIDTSLIEAGKDLYASARQAFFRVTLPLTMPGVVAGVLLTFIPASGDYINAVFLGGANNTMIGNKIQSTYLVESDYPEAAALSFLMMAAVLTVIFIYIRFAGTEAFVGSEEEVR
jgi:spermidine/putrescine transport system permease protein